jgi:hypothetical protein
LARFHSYRRTKDSAFFIVSLLIAAEAYYFFLDEKVTKNQDRKSFPPLAFTFGPLFCQATARL